MVANAGCNHKSDWLHHLHIFGNELQRTALPSDLHILRKKYIIWSLRRITNLYPIEMGSIMVDHGSTPRVQMSH